MEWTEPRTARGRIVDITAAIALSIIVPLLLSTLLHRFGTRLSLTKRIVLAEIPAAFAVAALVSKWHWWRRVGWRRPVWRTIWLLWLPVALLVLATLAGHPETKRTESVITAAVAVILVGFTEETWTRGVVLELFMSRGALAATVASAAVFAALHLPNARLFGFSAAAGQALSAFALGLMFGAARIRIGAIWPLVLLHAAFDFRAVLRPEHLRPAALSASSARSLLVLAAVAFVYAAVLTRRSRTDEKQTADEQARPTP